MENAQNMEVFKEISGYPKYFISNEGRIWSEISKHYLKPSKNNSGYYMINLFAANGKRKKELVHRLVALAFVSNPNHYPEVDHINRNKEDNRAENLRWVNRSMNNKNKNNKIKVTTKEGKEMIFDSITDAADFCGCHLSSIYDWLTNRCKSRSGYTIERIKKES